jgi:hypothetical protein
MISAVLILVILISVIVLFRNSFTDLQGERILSEQISQRSGIIESKLIQMKDFDTLVFNDFPDAEIRYGKDYRIEIKADKDVLKNLVVNKKDNQVYFSHMNKGLNTSVGIQVFMPVLKEINYEGLGRLDILDFNLDSLHITCSGAGTIRALNMSIQHLDLKVHGAVSAELGAIQIQNCILDIGGAAKIWLHMTGGMLSGQVNGASVVSYSGLVSGETVTVSAIGSLIKE